eukprot:TRINITY_DN521_c0_g3_i2.p2 TRINITY_DN521_c0_g3~~TRINITY_DN521_c0_g3_i2.p2  ORF type:complete len:213 (-),score=25.86 TRINITY_DN521_c0_g3_i2:1617-2255(-)
MVSSQPGMAEMDPWSEMLNIVYGETAVPCSNGNGWTALLGTSGSTASCPAWNGVQKGKQADLLGRDDIILRDGIVTVGISSAFRKWEQEQASSNTRIPSNGNQRLLRKCFILLREQGRRGGMLDMDFGNENGSRDDLGDVHPGGWETRHVICERERRQTESQCIATLRSLLPNLTKKDKASVLDRTVDYIGELRMEHEQLRRRKRKLEEGFL